MCKKLILRFCGIVAAFASFCGNIAYSYKEEAFKLALENARNNKIVRRTFMERIPNIEISEMSGLLSEIHNVRDYCFLLGCRKEDLTKLLDGSASGNCVDVKMIFDFMSLAKRVKLALDCPKNMYVIEESSEFSAQ